jgi:threonine/homoserine/homoserine lactone efflux protein
MNNAARVGFKKGIVFNFGILFGFCILMIICTLFSGLLFAIIPQIQFPMKIAGAAYMVYLIIKIVIPSKKHEVTEKGGSFFTGALLQFINPKLYIYAITAMSSFILPHFSSILILLLFAILLAFTGFVSTVCWAAFGSVFSMVFNKHGKTVNIIMSVLLLYCAVSLFL